jgi:hypothetical protein
MLLINATEGGIGPDEDYEGNTMWTGKGRIMKAVGLDSAPTVIIESKAFVPAFAAEVKTNQIFIRAQDGVDDMRLARALIGAAQRNRIPYRFGADAMPLAPGSLKKATAAFADKIIALAQELKTVDRALDKVRITAELARLVSEDAGGVTFMSNSVNDKVRSVGIMPRTGAVVSMIVPAAYKEHVKIPMLTPEDVCAYMTVILEGLLDYAKD